MTATLTLNGSIDRPLVQDDMVSERNLMVSVTTPAGAVTRPPLNLALVLDASGSMSGEKLRHAKDAAAFAVRHLTGADRVAIISYDDEVKVVAPGALLTAAAKAELLRLIASIETGGSTNLSGGWLAGCAAVAAHQGVGTQVDRAIVLTDGQANAGITAIDALSEHARQLKARGITTSTMGLGADFNAELLEAMARYGGGRFQYVETARHIPDCVGGELGEIVRVYARNLAVDLPLPTGVRVASSLNDDAIEKTPRGVRVFLGDVLAGDTRRAVLSLRIDPAAFDAEDAVEIALVAYYTADGQGREEAFPLVTLRAALREVVAAQTVDKDVSAEVALLMAAKAREEAARLSHEGDAAGAGAQLRVASQSLRAAPAAPAAFLHEANALDALAAQADAGLSGEQEKELHYQSYLRRQSRQRHS